MSPSWDAGFPFCPQDQTIDLPAQDEFLWSLRLGACCRVHHLRGVALCVLRQLSLLAQRRRTLRLRLPPGRL